VRIGARAVIATPVAALRPAPSEDRSSTRVPAAFALGVGVLLWCWRLGTKSLWYDEGVTATVAGMDAGRFAHTLVWDEANMSLYYALERVWTIGGDDPTRLRSLSVVAAIAAALALHQLADRLFGARAAAFSLLAFVVNALVLEFAQEARSSMLAAALVTAATLAFVRAVEGTTSWRAWAIYAVLLSLATYAHYLSLLAILAHGSSLIALPRRRAPWRAFAISVVGVGALCAPLLVPTLSRRSTQLAENPPITLSDLRSIIAGAAGGGGAPLALIVSGLVALGLWRAATTARELGRSEGSWRLATGLSLFLVPVGTMVLLSLVKPMLLLRYVSVFSPGLALVLGYSLGTIRRAWVRSGAVVALLVGSSLGVHRHYFEAPKEDLRGVVAVITERAEPTDQVVVLAGREQLYDYYRARSSTSVAPERAYPPPRFDPFPLGDVAPAPVGPILRSSRDADVWVVIPEDARGDENAAPDERDVEAILREAHEPAERIELPGVSVVRWTPLS
jgi:mannosyltransferase